jgi:hypothetical protein
VFSPIETKQIEEHITKLKDAFEFVEKHGSDKQAFLLAQTLKTDLSNVEEKVATLTEKAKYSTFVFSSIFSKFIDCFQYMFYELGGIYERLRSLSSLGRHIYGHHLCTCAMRLDETFPAANVIMVNAEVFKW